MSLAIPLPSSEHPPSHSEYVSLLPDTWLFDCSMRQGEVTTIIGVDEAGRGCLAGPIFAGAVILSSPIGLSNVDDSKRLTAKERETLAEEIKARALAWAIASAPAREIDQRGIDWANRVVFTRAIRQLQQYVAFDRQHMHVLIDGIRPALRCPLPQTTIKRGDEKSLSIAAASILAKTARDRYCIDTMHARYPRYGFDRHKGYATQAHRNAIQSLGPSREHRRSFSW